MYTIINYMVSCFFLYGTNLTEHTDYDVLNIKKKKKEKGKSNISTIDHLQKRRGKHSVNTPQSCITAALPPSRIRSDKRESARRKSAR